MHPKSVLKEIYKVNLALHTDLYQLSMAYGYWKNDEHETPAVFDLFFRKNPFKGGFAINAGLDYVIDYLNAFTFEKADLEFLGTLTGNDDKALFEPDFLEYLGEMKFSCDIDAIEEGRVVFANTPLIRVRGPIIQAQLIETALLNIVNFQTLIATKAARVCLAAGDDDVLEFGLRRAQGIDGGLSVARASYIGGVAATSNVLAGRVFGIPVKGTHAHSWVMFFGDEKKSFEAYADALPNNCVFLVDTYDTLNGVQNAVVLGSQLKERGHKLAGIRLDSGDLAYLSIEARKILDEGGFPDAKIFASNNLDEHIISSLKQQGAQIAVWGVGTKLATAYDQPALGGVYKLAASKKGGVWEDRIKISEQAFKVNTPGIHQVRRFFDGQHFSGDLIFDERNEPNHRLVDAQDSTRTKNLSKDTFEELLVPIFRDGNLEYQRPSLEQIRIRREKDLSHVHPSILRFLNSHEYPVGLDEKLDKHKRELMKQVRMKNQPMEPS